MVTYISVVIYHYARPEPLQVLVTYLCILVISSYARPQPLQVLVTYH